MPPHSSRQLLNAEGHEVSPEIKEMLSYMDGNEPASDYTRMLDKAVSEIKQSEERRRDYMSIYADAADMKELGEYRGFVRSVRDNDGSFTDDMIVKFLRISSNTLNNIRVVLSSHPDWDDEDVAEEVLNLEDE